MKLSGLEFRYLRLEIPICGCRTIFSPNLLPKQHTPILPIYFPQLSAVSLHISPRTKNKNQTKVDTKFIAS